MPNNISRIDSYDSPLMQYTGLKDRNGKDIYEGDIVFFHDEGITDVIVWDNDFQFHAENNLDNCQSDFDQHDTEIMGNIYANPELIPK